MKLVAEHLSYRLPKTKQPLLEDLSITLEPKQLHVVLGPNGAGKSTLFSLLSGHLTPHKGQIKLNNKDMSQYSAQALSETRAVLSQMQDVAFSVTVSDIVELGLYPYQGNTRRLESHPLLTAKKTDHEVADVIVQAALAQFSIEHLADRDYDSLSGGEKQRVQLARVFAQGAPLVLLDEPVSALDLTHQHQLLNTLKAACQSGLTIAVILHDINLALRYADTISLLQHGRLFATGAPADVITAQTIQQVYDINATVRYESELNCLQMMVI